MDPLAGALIGAGINTAGNVIGYAASQEDRDKARGLIEQALGQYGFDLPQLQQLMAQQLGPSAMEGLQVDPAYREAQLGALRALQEQGRGQLTLEDQAALADTNNAAQRQAAIQQAAIRQQMQARGQYGSGAELAMALQSASQGADQSARASRDAYANARARGLQALIQGGQMAGQMAGADWGRQQDVAQAKDQRALWNAGQRGEADRYNVTQLPQRDFANRMDMAGARAGNYQQGAGYYGGTADRTQAMWSGIGKAGGDAMNTAMQYDYLTRRYGGGGKGG